MGNTGCEKCRDLCTVIEIKHRYYFINAVRVIKDNLKDHTIVESLYIPPGRIRFEAVPFIDLPENGPWYDVLDYYFECTACHQLFYFCVDTYHGGSGIFKPVDRELT
jgi:hypothetical protein